MKEETVQQLIVTLTGLRSTEEMMLQEMMVANEIGMEQLGVKDAEREKIKDRRRSLVAIHDKIITDMMKEFRISKPTVQEKSDA